MSQPIILAVGPSGFVQLVRGLRSQPALDAKFVPTGPVAARVSELTAWSSHIAWTVKRADIPRGDDVWEIFINPWFLRRGAVQIPPVQATGERAAREWVRFLSQSWLQLIDRSEQPSRRHPERPHSTPRSRPHPSPVAVWTVRTGPARS